VLQTFQPHAAAILAAQEHSFSSFVESELASRHALGYSPFGRLIAVRVDSNDENASASAASLLASIAMATEHVRSGRVELLGPAPAPIARVRGRYRHRFLLKSPERRAVRAVANAILARVDEGLDRARAFVDVDPVSML
jgi:primosomal protein N' (replication factor Y)